MTNTQDALDRGIVSHACRMQQQLSEKEGNQVWSPLNIQQAMSTLYAGASGNHSIFNRRCRRSTPELRETRKNRFSVQKGLDIYSEPSTHARSFKRRLEGLEEEPSSQYETPPVVRAAARLWSASEIPLLPRYIENIQESYHGTVATTDFSVPLDASEKINAWAAEHTGGHIKELISEGDLSSFEDNSGLVLTTALHFKGSWDSPFDKGPTLRPWTYSSGERTDAYLMGATEYYASGREQGLDRVDIPFADSSYAMRLFVPRDDQSLAGLEQNLKSSQITETLPSSGRLNLLMPNFTFRFTVDLQKSLTDLGAGNIFDTSADFSFLTARPVRIAKVLHQAFIHVDDKGVEAAAATGGLIELTGMSPKPTDFIVDRPFLFSIYSRSRYNYESQPVLFMGRVEEPDLKGLGPS